MNHRLALLVAAILATGADPARAGEAQDMIFRAGLLDGVEVGETLVFARVRSGVSGAEGASPPIEDGEIDVAVIEEADGRRLAQVEVRTPGQAPSRTSLPADGGHPVLLVFLETTARTMAEATGGSPFYIRNRIRESFAADVPLEPVDVMLGDRMISAEAATFRPFETDPNRDRMGPFADLAMTITLSAEALGGFASFEAVGPGREGEAGYSETIAFDRLEYE